MSANEFIAYSIALFCISMTIGIGIGRYQERTWPAPPPDYDTVERCTIPARELFGEGDAP